jgi:DNA-binding SARP family transcriptional activator
VTVPRFLDWNGLRILGPLEVLDEGRLLALPGSKQRALLALLLLHVNETLTADRLIDELWAGRPPATAAKTLHAHVARLGQGARDRWWRLAATPNSSGSWRR